MLNLLRRVTAFIAAVTAIPIILICAAFLWSAAALAQDGSGVVTIPWGDLLATLLLYLQDTLLAALLAALTWVVGRVLPSWLAPIIGTARLEQLLTRAIDYAIATTAGAVKGQEVSVNVGNELAAKALRYAVEHGPGWLISWAGGKELLAEKIVARIPAAKDAALTPPR